MRVRHDKNEKYERLTHFPLHTQIVKSGDLHLKSIMIKKIETANPETASQNDRNIDLEAAMPVTTCTDEQDGKDVIQSENENKHQPMDLEKGTGTLTDEDEDGYEDGVLFLPQIDASQPKKSVPNLCAICLDGYRPGDVVVWSNNPQCCHAFHEGCVVHYLVKVKSGLVPCPTCRQCFVEMEPKSLKKGESNGGDSTSWGLAAYF
jgi:hypothetical protein